MDIKMVDVMLHIDESTTHDDREQLRDTLLAMDGVMAADYHDEKPHLVLVEYDPDAVKPLAFVDAMKTNGLHGELVGF